MTAVGGTEQKGTRRKLSEDSSQNGWLTWKAKAEQAGLPSTLSNTAITLLWISLGDNCWREVSGD